MRSAKLFVVILILFIGASSLWASSSVDTLIYIDKITYYKQYAAAHDFKGDTVNRYVRKGIELSTSAMDTASLIEFYTILGEIEQNKHHYNKAFDAYKMAQGLISPYRQKEIYANLSRKIGALHWKYNNYREASRFFNDALFYYKHLGLALEVGKTYNNLGTISKELSKTDSALYYYEKAIKIFTEIQDQEWLASTLNLIGNVYLSNQSSIKALENYKKSLQIRRVMGDSLAVSQSLTNIARVHKTMRAFDESIRYFKAALDIRQSSNDLTLIASSLNDIGGVYKEMGNYAQSIDYFQRALIIRRQLNENAQIAASLLNVGSIYRQLDLVETALSYYVEALEIYQKLADEKRISVCLNFIGGVYYQKQEYDHALDYYLSSLGYREVSGDKSEIADLLNNVAMIYKNMGNYPRAFEYYNQALEYFTELGNKTKHAATLNNIGNLYVKQQKYDTALEWLKKAYVMRRELNDMQGLAHSGLDIGQIFLNQKKFDAAFAYLNKALEIATLVNNFELKRDAYFAMYQLAVKQRKHKLALSYHVHYVTWKDSVFNYETLRHLSKVQMQNETERRRIQLDYENKQKQREIDRLKKNREEQEAYYQLKAESGRQIRNFIIVIAVSLFLVLVLLINRYIIKLKTNRKLRNFNDELSELNNSLKKSQKELTRLNATKDKFFSIIAHDLKNPFTALVSLTELLYDKKETMGADRKSELLFQINRAAKNTYQLLDNLLEWSRSQQGKLQFKPEYIDLYELIGDVVELQMANANQKDIAMSVQIDQHFDVFADRHMLSFVLRNIIGNAIKFTPNSGQIDIEARRTQTSVIIQIVDTGVGMSKSVVEQLFDLNRHYTTEGTNKEKGAGLGLILSKEFIEQHKGMLNVESTPGEGSKFIMSLPLKAE